MSEPMPVVRALYWPALLPQFAMILLVMLVARLVFPRLEFAQTIMLAAASYWVGCNVFRLWAVRYHRRGMAAYRARRFEEAIALCEASHRFFCAHPLLDAARPLYGIASRKPYRLIALLNMAYCHAQLGRGETAAELFERVLEERPNDSNARFGLNMLRTRGAVPDMRAFAADAPVGE